MVYIFFRELGERNTHNLPKKNSNFPTEKKEEKMVIDFSDIKVQIRRLKY